MSVYLFVLTFHRQHGTKAGAEALIVIAGRFLRLAGVGVTYIGVAVVLERDQRPQLFGVIAAIRIGLDQDGRREASMAV